MHAATRPWHVRQRVAVPVPTGWFLHAQLLLSSGYCGSVVDGNTYRWTDLGASMQEDHAVTRPCQSGLILFVGRDSSWLA
jgi:hypothetical protein